MRHTLRALVSVVLVACCCCDAQATESNRRWWHFGKSDEFSASASAPVSATTTTPATPTTPIPDVPPVAQTATQPQQESLPADSSSTDEDRSWMIDSPFAKVSWPRLKMPEVPKPHWPNQPEADATRNAWVEPPPQPGHSSPMKTVRKGARRVGQSTRAAWDKTVDVFTPDSPPLSSSSRVARRAENRPPIWKRMFFEEQPPEQGPQTITEWMAQERVDP